MRYYRVAESEKFADFFWVDVVGQELDDGLAVRVHHGLALFLQKKIINYKQVLQYCRRLQSCKRSNTNNIAEDLEIGIQK